MTNKRKSNGLALVMMVKNESFRIHVTLNSVLGFANTVVIFDTGSTDDTIDIITKFCEKYKLRLYIKQGSFVDFSTSRNELLSFADTVSDINFFLMLDCNDELQNGSDLIKFCRSNPDGNAFFLKQSWKAGIQINYYNIRLIRSNCGWRYIGAVHEYIYKEGEEAKIRIPNVVIFQDRTKDDNKSALRFEKDKELFLNEYNSDKKNSKNCLLLSSNI